jgi:hypothetical protein
MLTGLGPATFSSEQRSVALDKPGRTVYHEPWDYSTAAFLDRHTEDEPVADMRLFGTFLEYHRRPFVSEQGVDCYTGSCQYRTVVWFDSYRTVWQVAGTTTYWTSFEDGERSLSARRSKVYATGHSDVYVDTDNQ